MKAAREAYPGRRLVLVYQPHQHSRTKRLFNDFADALSARGGAASGGKDAADLVIVSEIYAVKGRMEDRDVSASMLAERITRMPSAANNANVVYGGDLKETKRAVLEHVKPNDVIIFMGAGDIDTLARELISNRHREAEGRGDPEIASLRSQ
jgi:UDP-N-acetylmuramate--alanine ligase